jgi:hypothetical protein
VAALRGEVSLKGELMESSENKNWCLLSLQSIFRFLGIDFCCFIGYDLIGRHCLSCWKEIDKIYGVNTNSEERFITAHELSVREINSEWV